jgi:hypothetical protein
LKGSVTAEKRAILLDAVWVIFAVEKELPSVTDFDSTQSLRWEQVRQLRQYASIL